MYTYHSKLIRVIDGDSLVAMVDLGFNIWKKTHIRLYGIDTPEIRTKDKEEKHKGKEVKNKVIELLENNDNEFTLVSMSRDKFGRSLGEIYLYHLGELSLNQYLIENNMAKVYYGGKRN